jgi:hypothetical protein
MTCPGKGGRPLTYQQLNLITAHPTVFEVTNVMRVLVIMRPCCDQLGLGQPHYTYCEPYQCRYGRNCFYGQQSFSFP